MQLLKLSKASFELKLTTPIELLKKRVTPNVVTSILTRILYEMKNY